MKHLFIKCLTDNIIWMLVNQQKEAIIVDCGDATPVIKYLEDHNINLKYILITHSHIDHIAGIEILQNKYKPITIGSKAMENKVNLDIAITNEDSFNIMHTSIKPLNTPGHCEDHISYYISKENILFSGDCLFQLGCGRNLEGNINDLYYSLQKIKKLPINTKILAGHDYIKSNTDFINSYNKYTPSIVNISSTLEEEIKNNPFLSPELIINNDNKLSNLEKFITIRQKKDDF